MPACSGAAGLWFWGGGRYGRTARERRLLLRVSLLPVGTVLFVLASLVALNLTVTRSQVLDPYLHVFDGSLGFQPSFVLGQVFERYKALAEMARATYFALPLVIALVCCGYLKYGSPWRPLGILASAGVLGYLLYFVFPATGPIYVSGASFPGSPQAFATLAETYPHPIDLPTPAPRNAMPSLHMAWALLLWFSCRPLSRATRALALTYVALTIIDTLGTGEHYLADLAVALPFSIAVQALWARVREQTRYAVLAGGTSLSVIWLVVLRYGTRFFLLSPAIPWACVIGSTIVSLMLNRFLYDDRQAKPTLH